MTDVDVDWPNLRFKSSYARSMRAECENRRKSLDFDGDFGDDVEANCDYIPECSPIFARVKSANVSTAKVKSLVAENGCNKAGKNDQVNLKKKKIGDVNFEFSLHFRSDYGWYGSVPKQLIFLEFVPKSRDSYLRYSR